jgi:molecular chaperone GrpE
MENQPENIETTEIIENNPVEETNTPTETTENSSEVAQLKQQIEELKDKYIRLFADFDNAKKRHAREQLELIQTAGKGIIQDLLPVLDDFERAMKTLESATEVSAVKEGIQLIHHKLSSTLAAKGLLPMETLHKDFNVEEHEALTEIPAPTAELAGKVVDEVQKGYLLNGKIIRFAKVVVGK